MGPNKIRDSDASMKKDMFTLLGLRNHILTSQAVQDEMF